MSLPRLAQVVAGGDDWLIARFAGADGIALSTFLQARATALRETGGWLDIVPGLADLAARFDPMAEGPSEAEARLRTALAALIDSGAGTGPVIEVPVSYGGEHGPDLANIATQLGRSETEIIAMHTGQPFLVQLMGFAPGFAYCGEVPAAFAVDRLDEPRQRVAAGSVGIAGRQTCLYSLAGPGGWPLIGRTPLKLFDPDREEPFLLRAGATIRFVAIDAGRFAELAGAR